MIAWNARALTLEESQVLMREFVRAAKPLVREARPDFMGEIRLRLDWADDYPSASSGDEGVTITGGLLRLSYLTPDALALILCHELGHDREITQFHVGRDKVFSGEESMADYFAGACLPRVLQASGALANFPGYPNTFTLSPRLIRKCQAAFPTPQASETCFRQAMASMIFIQFLYRELFRQDYDASGLDVPMFDRPWHGEKDFLQCRLINLENGIFQTPPVACGDGG